MEKSVFDSIYSNLGWLGFASLWLLLSALFAQLSGWSTLAEKFRAREYHRLEWQWFKFLVLTHVAYRSSALIGFADDGLGLDVFFLFKFQHPRLFIPKSEIQYKGLMKYFWWECETFEFVSCPTVVMRLLKKDGEEVKRRFGL